MGRVRQNSLWRYHIFVSKNTRSSKICNWRITGTSFVHYGSISVRSTISFIRKFFSDSDEISIIWASAKEKRKRSDSQPGHLDRFRSNKKFSTPNKTKTFYVNLYPEDREMRDGYSVAPDHEIFSDFVELSLNYSEDKIRFALIPVH